MNSSSYPQEQWETLVLIWAQQERHKMRWLRLIASMPLLSVMWIHHHACPWISSYPTKRFFFFFYSRGSSGASDCLLRPLRAPPWLAKSAHYDAQRHAASPTLLQRSRRRWWDHVDSGLLAHHQNDCVLSETSATEKDTIVSSRMWRWPDAQNLWKSSSSYRKGVSASRQQ